MTLPTKPSTKQSRVFLFQHCLTIGGVLSGIGLLSINSFAADWTPTGLVPVGTVISFATSGEKVEWAEPLPKPMGEYGVKGGFLRLIPKEAGKIKIPAAKFLDEKGTVTDTSEAQEIEVVSNFKDEPPPTPEEQQAGTVKIHPPIGPLGLPLPAWVTLTLMGLVTAVLAAILFHFLYKKWKARKKLPAAAPQPTAEEILESQIRDFQKKISAGDSFTAAEMASFHQWCTDLVKVRAGVPFLSTSEFLAQKQDLPEKVRWLFEISDPVKFQLSPSQTEWMKQAAEVALSYPKKGEIHAAP